MKTVTKYDIWDNGKKIRDNFSAAEAAEFFGKTNSGWASRYAKGEFLYKGRYKVTSAETKVEWKQKISVPINFKEEWDSIRFLINPKAKMEEEIC